MPLLLHPLAVADSRHGWPRFAHSCAQGGDPIGFGVQDQAHRNERTEGAIGVSARVQSLVSHPLFWPPLTHWLALAVRRHQHLAQELLEIGLLPACREVRISR